VYSSLVAVYCVSSSFVAVIQMKDYKENIGAYMDAYRRHSKDGQ
jgi:hypothetical protein